MIPAVFTYDFAERCLALIDALEPTARRTAVPSNPGSGPLTTTFAVAMAMPLIVIPIERLGTYNNASKLDRDKLPQMYRTLSTELARPFGDARFRGSGRWSLLTTTNAVRGPADWKEAIDATDGLFATSHRQRMDALKTLEFLNGIRLAMAHGSMAYLDQDGQWEPGSQASVIAFFANKREPPKPPTMQIYAVGQDDFLQFLRGWAGFLMEIARDETIDPPPLIAAA